MSKKRQTTTKKTTSTSKASKDAADSPSSASLPTRPSVFSRLGTKDSAAESKRISEPSTQNHPARRKKQQRTGSKQLDSDWQSWERNLDYDDELELEKKRQLLQRELAKQSSAKGEKAKVGKGGSSTSGRASFTSTPRNTVSSSRRSRSSSSNFSTESKASESKSARKLVVSSQRSRPDIRQKNSKTGGSARGDRVRRSQRGSSVSSLEEDTGRAGASTSFNSSSSSAKKKGKKAAGKRKANKIRKGTKESLKLKRGGEKKKSKGKKPAAGGSDLPSRPHSSSGGNIISLQRASEVIKTRHLGQADKESASYGRLAKSSLSKAKTSAKQKWKAKRSSSMDRQGGPAMTGRHGRSLSPPVSRKHRSRSPRGDGGGGGSRRNSRSPNSSSAGRLAGSKRKDASPKRGFASKRDSPSPKRRDERDRSSKEDKFSRDRSSRVPGQGGRDRDSNRDLRRDIEEKRSAGAASDSRRHEEDRRKDGRAAASRSEYDRDYERRSGRSQEWNSNDRGSRSNRVPRGNRLGTGANSVRIDDWDRGLNRGKRKASHRSRSREKLLPPEALNCSSPPQKLRRSNSTERSNASSRERDRVPEPEEQLKASLERDREQREQERLKKQEEYQLEQQASSRPDCDEKRERAQKNEDEKEEGENEKEEGEEDDDEADFYKRTTEEDGEVTEKALSAAKPASSNLAEDFSDFGDSDDELLNKVDPPEEEDDEREIGEIDEGQPEENAQSRASKEIDELSTNNVLEGISDEDLDSEAGLNESGKEKEPFADALGVDWKTFMSNAVASAESATAEYNNRKRRGNGWSMVDIFNRVGLVADGFPTREDYLRFIDEEVNDGIENEEDKFKPLDQDPLIDVAKRTRSEERKRYLYDFGPQFGGLTAKRDLQIRRIINGQLPEEPDVSFPTQPNSDWDWFRHAQAQLRSSQSKVNHT